MNGLQLTFTIFSFIIQIGRLKVANFVRAIMELIRVSIIIINWSTLFKNKVDQFKGGMFL